MTLPVIALTGGTGFVGKATLDALVGAGHSVRALARKVPPPRDGVEWVQGDLADKEALARLMERAAALIHLAGRTTAPDAAAFDAANVAGTAAVLAAAEAAGVRRLVLVSSLAAREPGLSLYGASKSRAERLVEASGLDWTIVRPPGVYGPWDVDYLEMFKLARRGLLPVPAGGGRSSLIHVEDLARLLVALLDAPGTSGQTYEPDDGHPGGWTHGALAAAVGAAVGRAVRVVPLPRRLLALVSRGDVIVRGAGARLTADRVAYMCHPDWTVAPERAVPASLWAPRIATPEGLAATARWYRRHGWL